MSDNQFLSLYFSQAAGFLQQDSEAGTKALCVGRYGFLAKD